MRGALRAGAKVIEAEAKANVPVKSGVLRDSIRVSARLKGRTVTASIKAGGKTKSGDAFYAKFVEFGTAAHAIKGRNGGWLSFGGLFAKSIQHPGMQAKPFMRPALDAKASDAVVAVGNYIKKRLTKQGLNTQGIEVTGENES
jgi:HK97 gp10 family phage protein